MTSLIPLRNEHFAVTVPEGATGYSIVQGQTGTMFNNNMLICFEYGLNKSYKSLPPGSYTIVALGSEISEEQAGEIMEGYTDANHSSFAALLASLSLSASTVVIIKQNK